MKKTRSSLFKRTAAASMALLSFAAPANQTKADNLNAENTRTIGESNKSAVVEKRKSGGREVAKVDELTGGLRFNHSSMIAQTNPIYFPKYHTKMTWSTQRKNAKQRRKSKS